MTDDPGSSTVIVRRRLRGVERKIHHSKSLISVMFYGSADGIIRPRTYIGGWTPNGPAGASYDVIPSGWFDQRTFQQWFFEIFLPSAKDLQRHENTSWGQSCIPF